MTPSEFVNRYGGMAQNASNKTGVPAILILAQAALESAWGKSAVENNFFGIKADKVWLENGGKYHLSNTHETINGKSIFFTEKNDPDGKYRKFRSYANAEESFSDWGRFLKGNPKRYGKVLASTSAVEAAKSMSSSGYATAKNYGDSLISVMGSISPNSIPASILQEARKRLKMGKY